MTYRVLEFILRECVSSVTEDGVIGAKGTNEGLIST